MNEELVVLESMQSAYDFIAEEGVFTKLKERFKSSKKETGSLILKNNNIRKFSYDLDGEIEANTFTDEDLTEYNSRIAPEVKRVLSAIKSVVSRYASKYKADCEFVFHVPKNSISLGYNESKDKFFASCYPMGYEPDYTKGKDGIYPSDIASKAIDDCMSEIEEICKKSKLNIDIQPCKDNTDTPYFTKTRFFIWLYMEEK